MSLQELQAFLIPNADISSLSTEHQELVLRARKEIEYLYTIDEGHTPEQKVQEQVVIENATLAEINA